MTRDEHLTPVLESCSEAELALIVEFLGRPPSGLLWIDARIRDPDATREERVAAIVDQVLRLGDHSVKGRLGGAIRSYLQVVCDVLRELELVETPGDGIFALELRVVHYVLDAQFDELPRDVQVGLESQWLSGAFFSEGMRDADAVHPFMTHTDAEHRAVAVGQAGRALGSTALLQGWAQVRNYARKVVLRLVLRRLAAPVGWALSAWDWLGPAYRYTVPLIVYVAYLRRKQQPQLLASSEQTAANS